MEAEGCHSDAQGYPPAETQRERREASENNLSWQTELTPLSVQIEGLIKRVDYAFQSQRLYALMHYAIGGDWLWHGDMQVKYEGKNITFFPSHSIFLTKDVKLCVFLTSAAL